jgi:hypothetical protein
VSNKPRKNQVVPSSWKAPTESVNGVPIIGAQKTGISSKQARMDCAALLIGAEMQLTQGDRALINQHMAIMCETGDMERLGAVTLTLLNYIAQYATQSGNNPRGLEQLIDHMLMEIGRM